MDIFLGQRVEEHLAGSTTWQIYVITHHSYTKEEIMNDQVIHFMGEETGFSSAASAEIHSDGQSASWKKIPRDLQVAFDDALENELGPSFRSAHYNLVGMSTGYKRIHGKLTEIPAIILYVRQKGIIRRGCKGLFPKKIRGFC